jgi:HEAT repeat protein
MDAYSLEHVLLAALDDPNVESRRQAIAHAARMVDPAELVTVLGDHENAERRNAAIEALSRAGARGVPSVIRALSDLDPEVVMFAAGILGKSRDAAAIPHLVRLLEHDDINVLQQAIDSLASLRASVAVEGLLKTLNRDPWLKFAAVRALGEIGDWRAVESLAGLLGDDLVGEAAIEALGKIGSPEALGHLARKLRETKDAQEFAACLCAIGATLERHVDDEALGEIAPFAWLGTQDALDVQLRVMRVLSSESEASGAEPDPELRGAAIELIRALKLRPLYVTLVMAGRDPNLKDLLQFCAVSLQSDLEPALLIGLRAPSPQVRALACHCLGLVEARATADEMEKLLSDRDERVRAAAASALGRFDLPGTTRSLVSLLADRDPSVREAAAGALGRMGADAVTDALLAHTPAEPLAQTAALEVIRANPHERQLALVEAGLGASQAEVRCGAIRASVNLPGFDVVSALTPMLDDPDATVRTEVVVALGSFKDRRARELLLRQIERDPQTLKEAIRSLGTLGDSMVAPHLIDLYGRTTPNVRLEIIETLAELREVAAEPLLVRILNDDDPEIRSAAVRALGKFATKSALRHVLAATRDPESSIRAAVVEVLAGVEEPAARAELERLCVDPNPTVADAARKYLESTAQA